MNAGVARVLAVAGVCVLMSANTIGGQTVITPPDNKNTLQEDVELGRQAAAEVQQQLPMLADEASATRFRSSMCVKSMRSRCQADRCTSIAA